MSDRFVLHASKDDIETLFGVTSHREDYFEPDYNISPGARQLIVVHDDGTEALQQARWGLIPPKADDERKGDENFSLAVEDLPGEDWIAESLHQRRCLVPAHGFYKWKTSEKSTTPFYIRLLSSRLSAFAGIYNVWKSSSGREVYSFAILTTLANSLVEPVDDRMPALLQPDQFEPWLRDEYSEALQKKLLKPFPLTKMAVNRVSEKVNDINQTGPELIRPIPK